MIAFLLALQAAATPPDIAVNARVDIKRLTIEKRGDARLTVTASPDAGSIVEAEAPRANGRKTLRNVRATVRGEARIADPSIKLEGEAEAEKSSVMPLP